jgi:hypothetical protein
MKPKLKIAVIAPPLWKNTPAMLEVFAKIAAERQRQRELFHAGTITFDCASTLPDLNRKLRVLMEEVGEVAQELERLEGCRDKRAERFVLEDLEAELVQVAAVATAWLESLQIKGGAR